eukprot:975708_1
MPNNDSIYGIAIAFQRSSQMQLKMICTLVVVAFALGNTASFGVSAGKFGCNGGTGVPFCCRDFKTVSELADTPDHQHLAAQLAALQANSFTSDDNLEIASNIVVCGEPVAVASGQVCVPLCAPCCSQCELKVSGPELNFDPTFNPETDAVPFGPTTVSGGDMYLCCPPPPPSMSGQSVSDSLGQCRVHTGQFSQLKSTVQYLTEAENPIIWTWLTPSIEANTDGVAVVGGTGDDILVSLATGNTLTAFGGTDVLFASSLSVNATLIGGVGPTVFFY